MGGVVFGGGGSYGRLKAFSEEPSARFKELSEEPSFRKCQNPGNFMEKKVKSIRNCQFVL